MPPVNLAIVDDKSFLRNSLQEQLSQSPDIEVVFTACDGTDFLDKIKAAAVKPEVVLMDIEMPELDGIQTVTIAKELYPSIRFLMFTVFQDDIKLIEAIKAGASGYMLKDEKIINIIHAVTQKEEGGAALSPIMAYKALELLRLAPTQQIPEDKDKANEYGLSDRELQILKLTVDGLNYQQVAEKLFISPATVRTHIQKIYAKLHVNNKTAAVKIALKKNWF